MANALATLFSDIATAIREKTGNTDKMAPLDFPDAISSIEVGSGGSGGTGGSNLPTTGAYWTVNPNLKYNYNNWVFIHNGELWAHSYISSSVTALLRYVDGAWVTVESTNAMTDLLSNIALFAYIKSDGNKLHAMSSDSSSHCIWDSTTKTWTKGNSLSYTDGNCACIYNGELVYRNSSNYFCKWNESDDSYTQVFSMSSVKGNYFTSHFFVFDGELYCLGYMTLYKYTDGAFELIADLSQSDVYLTTVYSTTWSERVVVHERFLYFVLSNSCLYKYNMDTGEITHVCYAPFYSFGGSSHLISYDGSLHIIGTGHASNYNKWLTLHDYT